MDFITPNKTTFSAFTSTSSLKNTPNIHIGNRGFLEVGHTLQNGKSC
jgi:hypothetical protein